MLYNYKLFKILSMLNKIIEIIFERSEKIFNRQLLTNNRSADTDYYFLLLGIKKANS